MASIKNQKAAPAAPVSKYAGVGGARAQRPANYFKAGVHGLYRINKVEEGKDKARTDLVAINGTIVHLFEDSLATANQVGDDPSEVIKSTNVAYMGRLKAFAMAVGDLTEEHFAEQEYDGQIFDELMGEEQPAAGSIVEVRSTQIVKQTAMNKPAAALEPKDTYTRVDFIRRVSFTEVQETLVAAGLDEKAIERLVPGIGEEVKAEQESETTEAE